jgi:hypothetical protein
MFSGMTPIVIKCESTKSYSTRRIIRQIQSINVDWPHNIVLSIYRRPGNQITLIELLSQEFKDKILASQSTRPFPFQVTAVDNLTTPPNAQFARWLADGASCLIRIEVPRDDEAIRDTVALWKRDRDNRSVDQGFNWDVAFREKEQVLPRGNPNPTVESATILTYPNENRLVLDDSPETVLKVKTWLRSY